jgi:negative regulator of sigma E activity
MSSHRYKVGQNVRLLQSALTRGNSVPCQVLQLMPFDGVCFDYRVHVDGERFDRAAKEHELAESMYQD